MSNDSQNTSNSLSHCIVVSKYFTKPGMDESSEFQEKKNFAKPKKEIPSGSKPKSKKIKRIRGQKDIRTALKSKKNELVAYSNEFDKICKQSGIDVDSEQLQLAIALSKSLEQSGNKSDEDSQGFTTLSSQDRTGKIKKTLQEYGFTVPDIKVTAPKKRRLKKLRQNYKLITTTESEKVQIITDKYSQILFKNIDNTRVVTCSEPNDNSSVQLYHLVTNVSYEQIKENDIFYVKNLLEVSPNPVGSLLRDWSLIPGRPKSPIEELKASKNIQFRRVSLSQKELDTVLSGPLKHAQEIVEDKCSVLPEEEEVTNNLEIKEWQESSSVTLDSKVKMDVEIIDSESPTTSQGTSFLPAVDLDANTTVKKSSKECTDTVVIDVDDPKLLKVSQAVRSCSPDIFDDDVTSVLESSNQSELISQESCKNATKVCDEIMDLTECVVNTQKKLHKTSFLLSQGSNVTKRRSNDFMDITGCVAGSSQPLRENVIEEENIDLTQNSDDESIVIVSEKPYKIVTDNKLANSLDLTQSSSTSEELPFVEISGKTSDLDETILLNEDMYAGLNHKDKRENISSNLESKNDNIDNHPLKESDPYKQTFGLLPLDLGSPESNKIHDDNDNSPQPIAIESEDEIVVEENLTLTNLPRRKSLSPINFISDDLKKYNNTVEQHKDLQENLLEVADLTDQKSPSNKSQSILTESKTESFYKEFEYLHSEDSSKENIETVVDNILNVNDDDRIHNNEDIDLTQSSSSSEVCTGIYLVNNKPEYDITNLGKVDNVSIDYDEVFDNIVDSHASATQSVSAGSNLTEHINNDSEKPSNSDTLNSSQNSEVFEISDKELDYSLHKSKLDVDNSRENLCFGGITVMDNLSDVPSHRSSEVKCLNRSLSDSFLPLVNICSNNQNHRSKSITKPSSSASSSPYKSSITSTTTKTPKQGEYYVKTDQVTPILDYNAMSTPEVNAELNKYGLKPFKRKRAIQLLTHIYNQTHPIVESCSKEDHPSPSKRLKPNTPPFTSPTKSITPKKLASKFKSKNKSPRKREETRSVHEIEKENHIYDVTNEVPIIKDIHCGEEDWVFQKREKAKVHSCRVPLHVAFHNYVSARPRLRAAILRYEPVNIDVIHKGLVENGHRYQSKELLKFMDKKCITVKTADNNARNKRH